MSKIALGYAMRIEDLQDAGENWTFVENDKLNSVDKESAEHVYGFRFLEHLPHPDVVPMLETVFDKMKSGAALTLTVPDLEWLSKQIIRFESGQILSGKYSDFEGKYGLQTLLYGDDRKPIRSGFVRTSLWELLDGVGFKEIKIEQKETQDETQILVAHCKKN